MLFTQETLPAIGARVTILPPHTLAGLSGVVTEVEMFLGTLAALVKIDGQRGTVGIIHANHLRAQGEVTDNK